MNIDRLVLAFAGRVILATLTLSRLHSIYWLWLPAFVGANLFSAGITGICPMARILAAFGRQPGPAFR